MKVTCPSCSTSYRLVDEKVPDSGAQIKCPKCNTIFVVRRNKQPGHGTASAAAESSHTAAAPGRQPGLHSQATPLSDIAGKESGGGTRLPAPPVPAPQPASMPAPPPATASKPSPTPNLDALSGEGFISLAPPSELHGEQKPQPGPAAAQTTTKKPAARATGMSAIRAQSGAKPKASLLESFRCRTIRGLTYDFPTRAAMIRWLSERDDLDGCEAAEPGGDWIPAASLTEFQAPTSKGTAEMIALSPGTPVAETKSPIPAAPQPGSYRAVSVQRDNIAAVLWSLATVVLLLTLFMAAGTLTRYGVFDFSAYLPTESVGFVYPDTKEKHSSDIVPSLGVAQDPEKTYRSALVAGRRAVKARKFSRAALEFNRALSIHPGSATAMRGLARAFSGLGDLDRAQVTMKKASSLGAEPEGK